MSQVVNTIELLISLILAVVVFQFWKTHRLDTYRQRMFILRDRLFDYALEGRISFADPAYRLLRKSMNGFIRYGHQLTFFQLCLNLLRWHITENQPSLDWTKRWANAVESIPSEGVKRDLEALHAAALALVVKRLILESPSLIIAVSTVTIAFAIKQGLKNIRQAAKTASRSVLKHVIDPRMLEEDAVRLIA
jgi:hypothetical protein